jgi:hypothetical protein
MIQLRFNFYVSNCFKNIIVAFDHSLEARCIMSEITRNNMAHETLKESVISMAVESWRFGRVFERLLTKLDAGEQSRYKSQFRWYIKKVEEALEQADLRIVNVEGHPFDPGMAATPLNIEEFDAKDFLMVDQMLEPIIMGKNGLVKTGTVTLKKVEAA